MKIVKPTLLVDEQKATSNIERMQVKARLSNATLRPHFKTHQSADVGHWFQRAGIHQATVSSVDMARYFAAAGWQDLTIAFPYNPLEADQLEQLARSVRLNVLITSRESLDHFNRHVDAPLGYFIKVDVGTHRTGLQSDQLEEILWAADSQNALHQLKGLLAHAGHTYKPLNRAEAQRIYDQALADFREISEATGRKDLIYSYGDTPSCSMLDDFSEMDELRPGNFVFYDIMQHHFNACRLEDIAVCLACPVVAIHPERGEAVIFGGAVHLSKDFIERDGKRVFGTVVALTDDGWETEPLAEMDRLSQEHGIIRGSEAFISYLSVGDLVGILPVHSCLAADLQGYYVSLAGERLEKLNKSTL